MCVYPSIQLTLSGKMKHFHAALSSLLGLTLVLTHSALLRRHHQYASIYSLINPGKMPPQLSGTKWLSIHDYCILGQWNEVKLHLQVLWCSAPPDVLPRCQQTVEDLSTASSEPTQWRPPVATIGKCSVFYTVKQGSSEKMARKTKRFFKRGNLVNCFSFISCTFKL